MPVVGAFADEAVLEIPGLAVGDPAQPPDLERGACERRGVRGQGLNELGRFHAGTITGNGLRAVAGP